MKPIEVGDEVEVYRAGARDPWRCEVLQLHETEAGLMVKVRLPGTSPLWFDGRDGKARGGWSLAPKHVPARAA